MRAVVIHEFGDAGDVPLGTLPDPAPGPDEVLVRIHAVAVNFVDLLVMEGKYQFLPDRPFAPGKLPCGVIEAVGSAVTAFRPGDRVQTMAEHGGYAELVAVPQDQCLHLPDTLSFTDAASMALAFDTAWFALRDRARIRPGESVLVLGATGAVGNAALQLANAWGARVLAGASSPDRMDDVLRAGADAAIDLSRKNLRDDLRAQVHAANDGNGVDIVIDPLGGDIFDAAIRALAWRGRLVVVGFAAGRIPEIRANYLLLKNIEVSGLQVSDYRKRDPDQMAVCFAELFSLYESGNLIPAASETFPLDRYRDALTRMRDRTAGKRLVLQPNR
ncbi:MAG: NADPH:quinone oxidoreductase family protein [Alphaproteobacteria bacterium]